MGKYGVMNKNWAKNTKKQQDSRGFSLIEISIVLIIIGILIVPILYLYNTTIQSQRHNQKDAAIKSASLALTKYALLHGHYPIPADPSVAHGAATFGQSAVEPGTGWPACHVGTTPDDVVCKATHHTYSGRSVLIGTLPFAEINVPLTSVIDPDKYLMTYAVTEDLTATGTYAEDGGGIIVKDNAGNDIYNGSENRSHFVVFFNGDDHSGAYAQNGTQPIACHNAAGGRDSENCDRDGTFRSNLIPGTVFIQLNEPAGVDHFDDYLAERNSTTSGLWSYMPISPTNLSIRDRIGGNAAIGDCDFDAPLYVNKRPPCIPVARLDVYGETGSALTPAVRADSVKFKRICNRGNNFGDRENTGSFNCIDAYNLVDTTAYQTSCIGAWCFGAAPTWSSTNLPPWFTAEMIAGTPPSLPPPEVGASTYWVANAAGQNQEFHRGNGIRCTGNRAMNGIYNYDESCNFSSKIDAASAGTLGTCAAAGTYARGIDAAGHLICQTPAMNP